MPHLIFLLKTSNSFDTIIILKPYRPAYLDDILHSIHPLIGLLLCKFIAHNVTVLIQEMYELNIRLDLDNFKYNM